MKLDKDIVRIAYAAREYENGGLENVYITDGEIIASDGYMIIRKELEDSCPDMAVSAKELIRGFRQLGEPTPTLELESDEAKLSSPNIEIRLKTKNLCENNAALTFKVFPIQTPKAEITLAAKVLKKFLKTLPDDAFISFGIRGETEPVEFVVGDCDIYGLIMPIMRGNPKKIKWVGPEIDRKVRGRLKGEKNEEES
jgi:hypothetical protein